MIPDLPISSSTGSSWLAWFDTSETEQHLGDDVLSFFENNNNNKTPNVLPEPTPSATAALFSPRNKPPNHKIVVPKKKPPPVAKQPPKKRRTLDAWQKQVVSLVTSPAIHTDRLGHPLQKKQRLLWGRQLHCQHKKQLADNSFLIVLNADKAISYEEFHTNSSMGQFLIDSRADYAKFDNKKTVSPNDLDGGFEHLQQTMRFELLQLLGIDLELPSFSTIQTPKAEQYEQPQAG